MGTEVFLRLVDLRSKMDPKKVIKISVVVPRLSTVCNFVQYHRSALQFRSLHLSIS